MFSTPLVFCFVATATIVFLFAVATAMPTFLERIDMVTKAAKGETYDIESRCTNCSFAGAVTVLKGYTVKGHECPNCGCLKLVKRDTTAV